MVVLMQVPSAVATRSVGENASPFPLLSAGASVASFDFDGPCIASQCRLPVYSTSTRTIKLSHRLTQISQILICVSSVGICGCGVCCILNFVAMFRELITKHFR